MIQITCPTVFYVFLIFTFEVIYYFRKPYMYIVSLKETRETYNRLDIIYFLQYFIFIVYIYIYISACVNNN